MYRNEDLNFKIDFVVTWVDGSDEKWLQKKNQFKLDGDGGNIRYRDFGIFKYWFRAVEKFAPWVNKVYLVTDNQIPSWLNISCSKLQVIDHKDIIPKDALPTFNSNAIELNVRNIKGLEEHFVLFNDDMFLNAVVKPSDFFSRNGLPKDCAVQNAIMPVEDFDHITANNIAIVNQNVNKKTVLKSKFTQFFNLKYSYYNILSILLLPWPRFTRFLDPHIPISLLKSEFNRVAKNNFEEFDNTTHSRFRSRTDISFWLVRYFQLVNGCFSPRSPKFGEKYNVDQFVKIVKDIRKSKHKVICINDVQLDSITFIKVRKKLRETYQEVLTEKSDFEM